MEFDRIILGDSPKANYSSDCSETGINNNIIVCAGTGGGKTMSVTEPRLLNTYNSSLVVTCTKHRIVDKYKTVFEKRGYNVLELDFTKPERCNTSFDPIKYVSNHIDVKFLASSIVMANSRKASSSADPFWDDSSTSLLSALILLVTNKNPDATIADVVEKFRDMEIYDDDDELRTSYDTDFRYLELDDPGNPALAHWKTFKIAPCKTARCIYSTLSSSMDLFFTENILKTVQLFDTVNFRDIADKKTILFITTSAVNPGANHFVNMFYSQLFKELFEYGESRPDGKLPRPVSVIADDFATGSRILNFPEYISIFREKLISVTLLLQSETQLSGMYGNEDAVSIINNCDTYVYMGGMDLKTCSNISVRANLPMEDILNMPVGQELIFRRGQKPLKTKRYNILEDDNYKQITAEYETIFSSSANDKEKNNLRA